MIILECHVGLVSPLATFVESVGQFLIWDSISAFMPIQYMDSHASGLILSIPI